MTELEFWAALVINYSQTAQRLPTLTSSKIRNGVPPPLRGVVWISITGARDQHLEERYEKLCTETSPYENLIGKDIGRSFPSVEMFKDPSGEGQQMLARVLKCFSLYDQKIGYCQGLGFVVGPLLMHMGDKEAFCVLVRLVFPHAPPSSLTFISLMEHYDLRSCFLPDLSGLHLRIYQFQHLLKQHLPNLMAYLESLQVEPLYVSQWFLSFFAVTCPLPMLLRIYDVILTEGASETLMRVALSLMRRNERKIKSCQEFEDVMHLLLSRELWDTYGCNADDLVNDFVGLTGLVTRERLEQLEQAFSDSPSAGATTIESPTPGIQAAASSFLGRFWAGSSTSTKSTSPTSSLGVMAPPRPSSFLRRSPSKQSVASTLNSVDTAESYLSTTSTEATAMSRNPSADCTQIKLPQPQSCTNTSPTGARKDQDLHGQIEDLLTALGDMQRQQNLLANELQQVREEREEDHAVVETFIRQKKRLTLSIPPNPSRPQLQDDDHVQASSGTETPASVEEDSALIALENHFSLTPTKRSSILQTKSELRDDLRLWKDQYEIEASRSADLLRQLSDQEAENARVLENNRDLEHRVLNAQTDKQNLEKMIEGLRSRRQSMTESFADSYSPLHSPDTNSPTQRGVDGYGYSRAGSTPGPNASAPIFSKRSSSLGIQAVLATEDHKPLPDEALLLELVNAKTSEALARQELEEVKGKLDSFRKMLGGTGPSPILNGHRSTPSEPCFSKGSSTSPKAAEGGPLSAAGKDGLKVVTPATTPGGGFFSGWGKRMVSNPIINSESPKSGVSSIHLPLAR